ELLFAHGIQLSDIGRVLQGGGARCVQQAVDVIRGSTLEKDEEPQIPLVSPLMSTRMKRSVSILSVLGLSFPLFKIPFKSLDSTPRFTKSFGVCFSAIQKQII